MLNERATAQSSVIKLVLNKLDVSSCLFQQDKSFHRSIKDISGYHVYVCDSCVIIQDYRGKYADNLAQ